jgi:hypothetical protein
MNLQIMVENTMIDECLIKPFVIFGDAFKSLEG